MGLICQKQECKPPTDHTCRATERQIRRRGESQIITARPYVHDCTGRCGSAKNQKYYRSRYQGTSWPRVYAGSNWQAMHYVLQHLVAGMLAAVSMLVEFHTYLVCAGWRREGCGWLLQAGHKGRVHATMAELAPPPTVCVA